ncbi:MAG: hypothetical protein IH932_02495 [Thaumarchaeota archaeon]|nr:hypothetical protein [Nitrososphaerota archaeon]
MNKTMKKNISYLIIAVVLVILLAVAASRYESAPPKDVQSSIFFEKRLLVVEMRITPELRTNIFPVNVTHFIVKARLVVNGTQTEILTLEPISIFQLLEYGHEGHTHAHAAHTSTPAQPDFGSNIDSMMGVSSKLYEPSWILFQNARGSPPIKILGDTEYRIQICTRDSAKNCFSFETSVQPYFIENNGILFHYAVFTIGVEELVFFEWVPAPPDPNIIPIEMVPT